MIKLDVSPYSWTNSSDTMSARDSGGTDTGYIKIVDSVSSVYVHFNFTASPYSSTSGYQSGWSAHVYFTVNVEFENNSSTNSSGSTSGSVSAAKPDLTIPSITLSKTSVIQGQSVPISFTVKNAGTATSKACVLGIYDYGSRIASLNASALGAGQSKSCTYTVPASYLTVGTHQLSVLADSGGTVSESNEKNNKSAVKSVTVKAATRDLVVSSISVSKSSILEGQSLKLSFTVKNNGNSSTARLFMLGVYDNGKRIASANLAAFSAGETRSYTYTVPANKLSVGTHQFYVKVDDTNVISETNGDNNKSAVKRVTVKAGTVDLLISSISLSSTSIGVGESLKIPFTVKNAGTGISKVFVLGVYDNGKRIASANLGAFSAGQSRSYTYTVPATKLTGGSHQFYIIVDDTKVITETNENNNKSVVKTATVKAELDLIISSVSVSSSVIACNQSVQLPFTVKNNGNATTKTFVLGIYDNGKRIASANLGAFSARQSRSYTYTVPANKLSVGNHQIYVKADDTNVVSETNETNNQSATKTVKVVTKALPDLIITDASSVSVSNSAYLSYTIKNQGIAKATVSKIYISVDGVVKYFVTLNIELAAGESSIRTVRFDAGQLSAGSHRIQLIADYKKEIQELDESNNQSHEVSIDVL